MPISRLLSANSDANGDPSRADGRSASTSDMLSWRNSSASFGRPAEGANSILADCQSEAIRPADGEDSKSPLNSVKDCDDNPAGSVIFDVPRDASTGIQAGEKKQN